MVRSSNSSSTEHQPQVHQTVVKKLHQEVLTDTMSDKMSEISKELSNKRPTYKIIVVGDSGVGKTCLTYRFCSGKFPSSSTDATIGVDFREKIVTIDACDVRLQLWDTAGQERFRKSMVAHYYRNVSAVVFVYDVTQKSSFEGLAHWIEECARNGLTTRDVPMIVVGNKCDNTEQPVQVQTSIAQRFSDDHGMPLFETSAKDDSKADHVEAIFLTLAHKVRNNKTLFKQEQSQAGGDPAVGSDGRNTVRIIHRNESLNEPEPSYCCF